MNKSQEYSKRKLLPYLPQEQERVASTSTKIGQAHPYGTRDSHYAMSVSF